MFCRRLLASGYSLSPDREREGTLHFLSTLSMPGIALDSFKHMIWIKNCSMRQTLLHNFTYEELRLGKVIRFADRCPISKGH